MYKNIEINYKVELRWLKCFFKQIVAWQYLSYYKFVAEVVGGGHASLTRHYETKKIRRIRRNEQVEKTEQANIPTSDTLML